MVKRVIGVIVLLLLVYAGYYYYRNNSRAKVAESGAYTCVGCMDKEDAARFQKENAGETADGQSEHKTMTARQEDATGFTNGQGGSGQIGSGQNGAGQNGAGQNGVSQKGQGGAASPNAPAASNSAATQAEPQQNGSIGYAVGGLQPVAMAAPTTDSQAANAPNGMRFAGSGNYQWYRQGNLTWRVDTATGSSCIVYATLEEWRKQVVMSHGCGRNA